MSRHSIKLERNELGALSSNTIGTDGMNAISSIPGTADVRVESETEIEVVISYGFDGPKFWERDTHLAKYHLRKKDN